MKLHCFDTIGKFFTGFLLSFCIAAPVSAQWQELARNVTSPVEQHVGALRFHGGVAWAGVFTVTFSTDTGKTWNSVPSYPTGVAVSDIAIYDSLHVLVSTGQGGNGGGLFLTTDGGATWQNFEPSGNTTFSQAAFLGSPTSLATVETFSSSFETSSDGGQNWNSSIPTSGGDESLCFAVAADATIYIATSGSNTWVNRSDDLGVSWGPAGGPTDGDSNTLSVDSCNNQLLTLVNENVVEATGGNARIDQSQDGGLTWQTVSSKRLNFYNCSLANTGDVLYVGTVPTGGNGVQRSIDGGATWTSIGGPTEGFDTRTIAAVNDNIVLVLDSMGNIWRTMNSGGDSLTGLHGTFAQTLELPTPTATIPQTACDAPTDTALPIEINGCSSVTGELDSIWLTGSSAFRVTDPRQTPRALGSLDSIQLAYSLLHAPDTSVLHFEYNIGSGTKDTSILLIGKSGSPLLTQPVKLHRELGVAPVGEIDSLDMQVTMSSGINFDSLRPFITDLSGTYSWDSSIVHYAGYTPPVNWSLTSLVAGANSTQFAIHNVSNNVSNPLDLGTALFESNGHAGISWVMLDPFTMTIGFFPAAQSLSFCVTYDEDDHWAVEATEGASVAQMPHSNALFSLYPNPAMGSISIASTVDAGDAQIEIYDMLGVKQREVSAHIVASQPIELLLPPVSGVYTIVIRSDAGTAMLRAIEEE